MKQQIFIDDIHEYDYELIDDNRHTLYYSNGEQWDSIIRCNVALQIIDTGNELYSPFGKNIDYAEAERLFVLLKLVLEPAKYEIATKKLL